MWNSIFSIFYVVQKQDASGRTDEGNPILLPPKIAAPWIIPGSLLSHLSLPVFLIQPMHRLAVVLPPKKKLSKIPSREPCLHFLPAHRMGMLRSTRPIINGHLMDNG